MGGASGRPSTRPGDGLGDEPGDSGCAGREDELGRGDEQHQPEHQRGVALAPGERCVAPRDGPLVEEDRSRVFVEGADAAGIASCCRTPTPLCGGS